MSRTFAGFQLEGRRGKLPPPPKNFKEKEVKVKGERREKERKREKERERREMGERILFGYFDNTYKYHSR